MRTRLAMTAAAALVAALGVSVVVDAQRATTSATQNHSIFAALSGKNERPRADRDGRGSFAATFDGNQLCYGYTVKNIADPAAAHIHKGAAGKNGDIRITLDTPASGDPGAVSECIEVDRADRKAILRRPARFYVNVHNADFPGGAVRGQLFPRRP